MRKPPLPGREGIMNNLPHRLAEKGRTCDRRTTRATCHAHFLDGDRYPIGAYPMLKTHTKTRLQQLGGKIVIPKLPEQSILLIIPLLPEKSSTASRDDHCFSWTPQTRAVRITHVILPHAPPPIYQYLGNNNSQSFKTLMGHEKRAERAAAKAARSPFRIQHTR